MDIIARATALSDVSTIIEAATPMVLNNQYQAPHTRAGIADVSSASMHGRTRTSAIPGVLYACFVLLCLSHMATAQTYPAKPIRIVVPLAAGGPGDVLAG